jgi:hypothetical protein
MAAEGDAVAGVRDVRLHRRDVEGLPVLRGQRWHPDDRVDADPAHDEDVEVLGHRLRIALLATVTAALSQSRV